MRWHRAVASALLGLLAVACNGSSGDSTVFTLAEFAIDGPERLGSGTSTITASNVGEFPHTIVVTDSDGTVVAGSELIQPGQSADLDLTLDTGTYQFTCRIVAEIDDGTFIDHFEAGMLHLVEVSS
jgi:plastocyanin